MLQYLYPTFTAALAWGALGERAGKRILLAMALGWLGVARRPTRLVSASSQAIAPWIPPSSPSPLGSPALC